jgi:hypothetical protein
MPKILPLLVGVLLVVAIGCSPKTPTSAPTAAPPPTTPAPDALVPDAKEVDPVLDAKAAEDKAVANVKRWGGFIIGRDVTAMTNSVTIVSLHGSKVTDAELKELAAFKRLLKLELGYTSITDAGMKELVVFKDLNELDLSRTWVTDAGLKHLAELKHLEKLDLSGTSVTDAGVADLQKALPKCEVVYGPLLIPRAPMPPDGAR